MGRIIGIVLIAVSVIACFVISLLMGVYSWEGGLSFGAATLGFGLGVGVIVLPLLAIGVFLVWHGRREEAAMAHVNKQRQLLNIIKTRGQVNIGDLVIEMKSSRQEVQNMLYDLVGKGLYSGYVNWDEGVLYSAQASQLRQLEQCRNCGGQLQLAGKGVIRCPFCGTEYFLES
jgi:hypothetical protein